jgi:competence protein ComEC
MMLGIRRWLIGNACVSAAAWLGSLPFILLHFQAVTPVALIANSVLVPLSIAALAVTCMSILAALIKATGMQIAINNANWFLAKAMVISATWFSSLPGSNFHLNTQTVPTAETSSWRVLAMPDGGAANHLRLGTAHWLLDTGPEDRFRTILHRYLRHEGVNKLRGLIMSHNDAAHIGAVDEVRAIFGMPELFCSAREPGPYDARQTILRRLEATTPLKKWIAGDGLPLSADASLTCLHPSTTSRSMRGDDRAMVLMAVVNGWRVLWMSDAGWLTENALLESGQPLRCDVLITSQHATDACGTQEFLDKAMPRLVIRGSSGFKRDHTPPPDTLAAWCAENEVPLWFTAELGSMALEFSELTLNARTDSGRMPPMRLEKER